MMLSVTVTVNVNVGFLALYKHCILNAFREPNKFHFIIGSQANAENIPSRCLRGPLLYRDRISYSILAISVVSWLRHLRWYAVGRGSNLSQ